ncbi:MAG: ParB/RepB/Spo0J family partition protein [Acidobacteria bacterium]|nr:ParB/RepB/Spo0J family partition protein [Acidobacteriota bacterium]
MARNALGRGLSALIRDPETQTKPAQPTPINEGAGASAGEAGVAVNAGASSTGTSGAAGTSVGAMQTGGTYLVDIDLIDPSPFQPRTHFREESLEELARSIQSTGMIQPLVVRRVENRFQLIAGERRWRAAQRAAMMRVPAVIRDVPDEKALEITLVENIQREDLNPLELARAFDRLMMQFSFTQDMVAERTGKDRVTVANAIRLLRLDPGIQQFVEEGKISASHARALLAIEDLTLRKEAAQLAARGAMSVRQIERLASRRTRGRVGPTSVVDEHDANTRAALEELQRAVGTKVMLKKKTSRSPGQLILEYYDEGQLQGLYDRLMR